MKRLSFSALLLLFVVSLSAQLRWDVKAGMSVANMTQMEEGAKFGYTVGIGADYAFSNMFSLQTGINFTSKGTREVDVEDDYRNYNKEVFKVFSHYAELPVLAAVKFQVTDDFKVLVNAGPYFAMGLAGKEEYTNTAIQGVDYSYDLFKDSKDNKALMNRFDTGLQFGVGTELNDHFLINLTGQCGFISPYNEPYDRMYGDDGKSPKNLNFMITAGYRF